MPSADRWRQALIRAAPVRLQQRHPRITSWSALQLGPRVFSGSTPSNRGSGGSRLSQHVSPARCRAHSTGARGLLPWLLPRIRRPSASRPRRARDTVARPPVTPAPSRPTRRARTVAPAPVAPATPLVTGASAGGITRTARPQAEATARGVIYPRRRWTRARGPPASRVPRCTRSSVNKSSAPVARLSAHRCPLPNTTLFHTFSRVEGQRFDRLYIAQPPRHLPAHHRRVLQHPPDRPPSLCRNHFASQAVEAASQLRRAPGHYPSSPAGARRALARRVIV